ncbi:MAG: response regulator, partial [Gammaproteobacteria bacterium]|nr:response regulator [Gammaproteobacteria bacterium]NIV01438.1 response regulator [Phycisphaerae bacterium]NIW46501.1 response regulator [Gammaproteobacteria bacterium]
MDDKQHHVLIVDDVQDNLDLLQRILEGWDYSVGFALDGFAALDLARQNPFDAIILDIMMPGIDGIETCRRIREDLELHTVPIIMLTGMDDNTTLAKCLEVGADDFIAKPFNRIVLRARLESAIRRKELEDVILNTNQYLEQKVSERTS